MLVFTFNSYKYFVNHFTGLISAWLEAKNPSMELDS